MKEAAQYLGLSVKGIRLRGAKSSGMQGPAPGFEGKRWFGPIMPLIIGILGNMEFPEHDTKCRLDAFIC